MNGYNGDDYNFNLHLIAMKKMLFLAILICFGAMAFAQKVYFIYIQSEAGAPFYVKLGEKVYSSTASGYVILPKLKDSTYTLFLGQPSTQVKELRFSVDINNTDLGFLFKNFQNGWALFNLQSMAVINPTPSTSGVMYDTNTIKNDLFTRLLSKAVDDSTLLMEPVLAKREEAKPSKNEDTKKNVSKDKSEPVVIAPETVAAKEDVAVKPTTSETVSSPVNDIKVAIDTNNIAASDAVASKQQKAQKDSVLTKEVIVPQETVTTKEPTAAKVPASTDTAAPTQTISKETTILTETVAKTTAPKENTVKETTASKETAVQNTSKPENTPVENNPSEEVPFKRSVVKKYAESSNFQGFGLTFIDTWEGKTDTIRMVIPNTVDATVLVKPEQSRVDSQAPIVNTQSNQVTTSVVPMENDSIKKDPENVATVSNCKVVASNNDFLDLRKNMASKDRGEEMLEEARKAFSEKCYTTEQVRKLSVLFYTQEGKFLFFKEAQPYVSDKDRFNTLLFELNEDSYQDRFKSLLENKI